MRPTRRLLTTIACAAIAALVVSLVGLSGASPTRNARVAAKRGAVATPPTHKLRGLREIASLRTRTSRTFAGAKGVRVARISMGSVNYRDARGRWRPIDSRLRRRGASFVNRANRYRADLPTTLGGRRAVRVRRGKLWTSFRLRRARGAGVARGSGVRYPNALPGVDLTYRVQADALKEALVLRDRRGVRSYVFDLGMARGLRPSLLRTKGLVFRDRRGREQFSVGAPYMWDARGHRSRRVRFALKRVDARWRLTLTPDSRWLRKAGRRFPVTVDPYTWVRGDADCTVDSSQPDLSLCNSTTLEVGTNGTTTKQALLRFDVNSAIPPGSDVLTAALGIDWTGQATTNTTKVRAYALSEPWTGAASWNRTDGTHRWTEGGGEHDAAMRSEDQPTLGGATPNFGYQWWQIRQMTQEWVNDKRANHGLVLKTEDPNNLFTLRSAEYNNGDPDVWDDRRPALDLQYVARLGERRGYRFEEQKLSDRIDLKVNVANGNLLLRQSDFRMPGGLGPDVVVSRSYNSQEPLVRQFGQGWTLDTGHGVRQWWRSGSSDIEYRGASGIHAMFEDVDNSLTDYRSPPGFNATMKNNTSDWSADLTFHQSQAKQHFTPYGRLDYVEDRNGRRVSFAYSAANASTDDYRTTTITDANGDAITFDYTGGGTTKLMKMTDPSGRQYVYGYDTNNRLTSYTDPASGVTAYEYNACGLLTKVTTPAGRITLIDYENPTDPAMARVKTITRVTDTVAMTGPTTSFSYQIEPDGSGSARVTDPIGTASPDANDRITRYEFDDQSRVTETRDALRRKTSVKLTSNSNVESYTSASNTGTTPNTSFTYDAQTDNMTGTSTFTGSGSGAISTSGAYGEAARAPSGTKGGQWLMTAAENAHGRKTQYGYAPPAGAPADTNGNLYSIRQLDAGGGTAASADFRYDTAPDGKGGRLVGVKDGRGNETTYGYDAKGNVNRVDRPQPATASGSLPGPTDITYHSTLARVDKVQDGARNWRCLAYDNLDRVTAIRFSVDNVCDDTDDYVKLTYDADGNVLTEVDKTGGTTTNTYDKLNRLTYEALPGGRSNTYTYDVASNLRTLLDGGGKVEYTYDPVNNVRAVFEPSATKATKFEYDKDGRRTKTIYPNSVVMENKYDDASRMKEIASTRGTTTLQRFTYDYLQGSKEGWLRAEQVDTVAAKRTRYAYDDLDRLTRARTEGSAGTATAASVACATTGGLACFEYTLDGAANRLKERVTGTGITNRVTSYGYNKANQLCWWIGSDQTVAQSADCPTKPTGANSPTYDANGNETSLGTGRTATYNRRDQTTGFTIGGTTSAMAYLGAGQDQWTGEGATTFQHNVLGLSTRTAGTTTNYWTRDDKGTPVTQRTGTTKLYYLLDALGSVSGLTDSAGNVARSYEYEPYGKVSSMTGTAADHLKFAGGYEGVGGLVHFGQRYYDPALGRWTQPDPLDQAGDLRDGNPYLYVSANPVNGTDPGGLHPCGSPGPHAPQGENNTCNQYGYSKCPGWDVPFHAPCPQRNDKIGPVVRGAVKAAIRITGACARGAITSQARKPGWAGAAQGCAFGAGFSAGWGTPDNAR